MSAVDDFVSPWRERVLLRGIVPFAEPSGESLHAVIVRGLDRAGPDLGALARGGRSLGTHYAVPLELLPRAAAFVAERSTPVLLLSAPYSLSSPGPVELSLTLDLDSSARLANYWLESPREEVDRADLLDRRDAGSIHDLDRLHQDLAQAATGDFLVRQVAPLGWAWNSPAAAALDPALFVELLESAIVLSLRVDPAALYGLRSISWLFDPPPGITAPKEAPTGRPNDPRITELARLIRSWELAPLVEQSTIAGLAHVSSPDPAAVAPSRVSVPEKLAALIQDPRLQPLLRSPWREVDTPSLRRQVVRSAQAFWQAYHREDAALQVANASPVRVLGFDPRRGDPASGSRPGTPPRR